MSNVCPVCNGSRYVTSPMADALKVALWAKKHGGAVHKAVEAVGSIEMQRKLDAVHLYARRLEGELTDARNVIDQTRDELYRAKALQVPRRESVSAATAAPEPPKPAVLEFPPEPPPKPVRTRGKPAPRHPRTIDPASIDEHEPGALYASARNDCEPIAPPPVSHVSSALAGEYSLPDWITELVDAMELQAEAMHS